MHLIPIIGLIALLLGAPIPAGDQPAAPTAASPIADLHARLGAAAAIPGPYVLAAHSL